MFVRVYRRLSHVTLACSLQQTDTIFQAILLINLSNRASTVSAYFLRQRKKKPYDYIFYNSFANEWQCHIWTAIFTSLWQVAISVFRLHLCPCDIDCK